ncbi:hypothetical protein BJ138DRAFT_971929, partial [Hygrophoropsis aurantiaca]
SARRLRGGSILLELESREAANWLNSSFTRDIFVQKFLPGAVIKGRNLQVIAEGVPISLNPDSEQSLTEIAEKSGLDEFSITKARWIKPLQRRSPQQKNAHIILTFSSKEAANKAIRQGLNIEGKRVFARKLLPEPPRCLKCHSLTGSHFAAKCPSNHDTCGTCGEEHRTSDCFVTDPAERFCANCKTKGHAAWERSCPAFTALFDKLVKRNPEAKYRFFPTEDPATW